MENVKIDTDWKCIATEGLTIDGRFIKREWIESIAKNYSLELYPSLIWCEHADPFWRQFECNFGEVLAIKCEEVDSKLKLFAKLSPNQYLLDLNAKSQKLFTSIEVVEDYPAAGEFYLGGLAVTDQPASSGTTKLRFSSKEHGKSFKVFTGATPFTQLSKPNSKQGKFNMTEEEIQALKDQNAAKDAEIATLKQTIEDLQNKLNEQDDDDKNMSGKGKSQKFALAEITKALAEIQAEQAKQNERWTELDQKVFGKIPTGEPGNNSKDVYLI